MGSFSTFMTLMLGVKFIIKPVMTTKSDMEAVSRRKRIAGSLLCGAMVGFICTMYTRLNSRMNLDLSKAGLAKLASGVIRYLMFGAAAIGGTKIASTLLSMTGVGNAAASILMAGVDYGVMKISGIVYLNIVSELMAAGKDIEQMNADELDAMMQKTVQNTNVKAMMKQMKNEYAECRKNGTITGEEKVEPACEN